MKFIRRNTIKTLVLLGLVALSFLAGPVLAAGEDYPAKPVIITVGMNPGGSASISAHIFAESVKKYLDKPQPFIINHKPGASGMIGLDYVMKQPADGYNLFWASSDSPLRMALEPEKFSFKKEDFSYIGTFIYSPYTLSVNSEGPFKDKTFEDFIDYAKKHPGEMTISTPGIASGGHFTTEVFMNVTGIKLTHVPFVSGNPAMLAMLGGHVTCTMMSPGTIISHTRPGGKDRVLVVFDTKRYPELPNVPTCIEKGYNVIGHTYMVLVAKKGTPKPVLDTLVKLFKQTCNDPNAQSTILKGGMIPACLSPEETEKKVNQDFELIREIFGKLGLLGK